MYMSNFSNHLNEVVIALAIISLICIPLTFITGVYSMYFIILPKLE